MSVNTTVCPVCNEHIGKGEIYCTNCGRKNDEVN